MVSVITARSLILQHTTALSPRRMPLSFASLGRVLAEDVASDLDMPPFDKALMDGYAVHADDLRTGTATLHVVEEIAAGQTPRRAIVPGQCSRIMTGAPIPAGADAVVVVERTRLLDAERVEVVDQPARPGQNLLRRGLEMRLGEKILSSGTVLRPQELGILATLGKIDALQIPAPRVAVLATGDELVEPPLVPGPGQIRNSNAPMLLAQAARAGCEPHGLGIARDRLDHLQPLVEEGLRAADVLILSGGVSAGKLDLVPDVLRQAGVVPHFHKVEMKPGKPLFFGTCARAEGDRLVFGLPGNPLSSFVCFELFIRPALRRLAGHATLDLPQVRAALAEGFAHASDRPTYHPAVVRDTGTGWSVRALPWQGSAILRTLLDANALLLLPSGKRQYAPDEVMDVLRLDG